MKLLNKYTYLFIGILALVLIAIFAIIPRFQTQEFDPNRVVEISEGVTTTTQSPENNNQTNQTPSTTSEISEVEKTEIEKLLLNNKAELKIDNYKTYLLIGSDERDENSSASRGFVGVQRADVIIIGLIDNSSKDHHLLSIPRDTLIINSCTKDLERINGSYSKNDCGNKAENLAAAVTGITGIKVDHFASFNFEGFENIIDSFKGI